MKRGDSSRNKVAFRPRVRHWAWVVLGIFLAACTATGTPLSPSPGREPLTATRPATTTPQPTPTATPVPLAARVNDQGIPLAVWETEVRVLRAGLAEAGTTWDEARIRETALAGLIAETLLAQAAAREGRTPTEQEVQRRLQTLAAEAGGMEPLARRVTQWGYPSLDAFREALERSMAAARMREEIVEQALPQATEHVEAYQILLFSQEEAQQALALLRQGTEFYALARSYDPATAGYLGWMPRKVWPTQEMEEAVFGLAPGTFTEVLATPMGYHIVYVHAREERPLAAWARRIWARQALREWLVQAWSESRVEILLPGMSPEAVLARLSQDWP